MRKILFIGIFICCTLGATAQLSRVITFSSGFSFLTDGMVSDVNLKPDYLLDPSGYASESYQYYQWNFVSGIFSARILLIPMTLNSSISASASPMVSFGAMYPVHNLSRYDINASVPMYLELNVGAASRYVSNKDWGITLGTGIEYFVSPLCSVGFSDDGYDNSYFKKSWFLPSGKIGLRYWSKKNKVNEIILRGGIGEKQEDFYTFDGKLSKQYRPMHFGLSFLRVLNY